MQSPIPEILAALLYCALAYGDTVKDRAGAIRGDRAEFENDSRWNYNDVQRGFAQAKRTGKPLLVVLRCVPCLACAGMDAAVLHEAELKPLLDQFVCVRLINANNVDLSLLQFDYDLSFSTIFFNPDGTVYGRYGSWMHQKNSFEKSTAGYKRALEAVLALHQGYATNKTSLAGKQPGPIPFKDPLTIPALAGKYTRQLDWDNKIVQSCVHCHQIGDAIRAYYRGKNEPVPSQWVYPMPPPETIGLTLAGDQVARVSGVADGSIAATSGLQAGDDIVSMDGQPLVSTTDLSWVLHRAADSAKISAVVRRGKTTVPVTINLPDGWRMKADISRRVGTWGMRAMALGGLVLEDLSTDTRRSRNLPEDKMALLVKHVGQYNEHAAAKNAGFQKDDVVVRIDGQSGRISEGELIGRLLQRHRRGEKVQATVLRGGQELALTLPMQ